MQPFLALVGICLLASHNSLYGKSDELPDMLIFPSGYIPAHAPKTNKSGEDPYFFTILMDIWEISDISLRKQVIEVDLELTISWIDPRLRLHPNISSSNGLVLLSKAERKKIWTPTVIFQNCRGCDPYSVRSGDIALSKSTGTFYSQTRIQKDFSCPINLRAYPMDVQFCHLWLHTYQGYAKDLQLKHKYPNRGVINGNNLTLAEYLVSSIVKGECIFQTYDKTEFPCLELRIRLEHLIAFHLMTLYAPTTFIVSLSWISFWLPLDLAPARVALGLTSLLTLATRLDQAQKDLPPVAYVKAIDVWMFACIFLVSASLCEFAISHYSSQISKSRSVVKPIVKVEPVSSKTCAASPKVQIISHGSTFLDRTSRFLFPLMFLIFNVAYWGFYLTYYQ